MPTMSSSHGRATSAGGLRPNAGALNPRQLTSYLGNSRDLAELLSLQQRHGDRFDGFHISAFWSKFKSFARGELGGLSDRLVPVCEQTLRMLPELDARQVANVAHAFAKARLVGASPWEIVWAALPEAVCRRLGDFKVQDLSITAWAFANAGQASPELYNAISAEVVRRWLGDFDPQDISNTAWAFAKAGHASPELYNAISAEVVRRRLGHFNPQDISNTAWAFATVGHASPELYNAISAEVVRRWLGDFNPQDISNMAWAFAVSNPASADELFGTTSFVTRCAHFETSLSLTDTNLSQLHQWSLWRDERGAQWPGLPNSLRQACSAAFVAGGEEPSQLQADVVRKIRSRVPHVEEEHRCQVSGYSIDALVTLKDGKKVAVEVDGPSHFVGCSQQPTGATLLKHRQLRYFGMASPDRALLGMGTGNVNVLHWLLLYLKRGTNQGMGENIEDKQEHKPATKNPGTGKRQKG